MISQLPAPQSSPSFADSILPYPLLTVVFIPTTGMASGSTAPVQATSAGGQIANPTPVHPQNQPSASGSSLQNSRPVQSTPSSTGLAVQSEHGIFHRRADINPVILEDVKKYTGCKTESMLQGLLSKVTQGSIAVTVDDLIQKYTLKIAKDDAIGGYLKEYCQAGNEKKLYKPFTLAMNMALQKLEEIQDNNLLPPSNDPILFHVNDPLPMQQSQQSHPRVDLKLKPDIELINLSTARSIYKAKGSKRGPSTLTWKQIALDEKRAGKEPPKHLAFSQSLVSAEFKRVNTSTLNFPQDFSSTLVINTKQEYLQSTKNGLADDSSASPFEEFPSIVSDDAWEFFNEDDEDEGIGEESEIDPEEENKSEDLEEENIPDDMYEDLYGPPPRLGTKRPYSDLQSSGSAMPGPNVKKKANQKVPLHKTIQSAIYATERLTHSVSCMHSIGILIQDTTVWIWWYDHQGAIQSQGFDFVKSFPHFLVFLLILQRFRPRDWGIHPDFSLSPESNQIRVKVTPSYNTYEGTQNQPSNHSTTYTCSVNEKHQPIDIRYCMKGRATRVFRCTVTPDDHSNGAPLVCKFYWPEESRENETNILRHAYELAKQCHGDDPRIRDHLPELFYTFEDPASSTANIRRLFGIDPQEAHKGARVFRGYVFLRLYPILGLACKNLLKVYWEVFACHYALWRRGLYHGDISVQNLMVKWKSAGVMFGVLNDWDLARVASSHHINLERTGTLPFMALELLTDAGTNGQIKRSYRHDAESFTWVLLWIVYRVTRRKELPRSLGPFRDWLLGSPKDIQSKKTNFGSSLKDWEAELSHHPDQMSEYFRAMSNENDLKYYGINVENLANFWVTHHNNRRSNLADISERDLVKLILQSLSEQEAGLKGEWHPLTPDGVKIFHETDDKL